MLVSAELTLDRIFPSSSKWKLTISEGPLPVSKNMAQRHLGWRTEHCTSRIKKLRVGSLEPHKPNFQALLTGAQDPADQKPGTVNGLWDFCWAPKSIFFLDPNQKFFHFLVYYVTITEPLIMYPMFPRHKRRTTLGHHNLHEPTAKSYT